MVLVVAEEPPIEICRAFGYTVIPVRGEPLGTRIVQPGFFARKQIQPRISLIARIIEKHHAIIR